MSRPASLTESEIKKFEKVIRCFVKGELNESVKDYITQNKWVLEQRVPERYCLRHDMYENNCTCKVSKLGMNSY